MPTSISVEDTVLLHRRQIFLQRAQQSRQSQIHVVLDSNVSLQCLTLTGPWWRHSGPGSSCWTSPDLRGRGESRTWGLCPSTGGQIVLEGAGAQKRNIKTHSEILETPRRLSEGKLWSSGPVWQNQTPTNSPRWCFIIFSVFYLCPPPDTWCLSHSLLRLWRLPADLRGPRCTAGSLGWFWKNKPSEGRAAPPTHDTARVRFIKWQQLWWHFLFAAVVSTNLSLDYGPQQLQDSMSGLRWLLWRQHVLHGFP